MAAAPSRPRVLLVGTNQAQRPYPVPPLGLCLLAERLRDRFDVRVHDGMFDDPTDPGRLRAELDAFRPRYVGLGIRNVDDLVMERPTRFLEAVRDRFVRPIRDHGEATLLLGGSGFSLFPRQILAFLDAPWGVVGEGEHALPALLDALERGEDPSHIPGVLGAGPVAGGTSAVAPPRTALRCAAADLAPGRVDTWVDFTPYRARGSYPIQTRRGCAAACAYCTYPALEGTSVRLRRAASIVDEIQEASARLGPGVTFEFVDSTFNLPADHARDICETLVRRGVRVRLRAMGFTPRGLTRPFLELAREAGFSQMDCGPDSGADPVLQALHKGFTRADLEEAARAIQATGMPTLWFLLFGGPGETPETVARTFDFVDRFVAPEDMVHLGMGLRIYPGTPLERRARADGLLEPGDDLFADRWYVSPALGRERLRDLLLQAAATRPHCVPAWETAPDPAMMARALELRRTLPPEPMFRSLLRVRRERMGVPLRDTP